MSDATIPFNKPYMTGKELHYISQAHINARLAGDGPFTQRCHQQLEVLTNTRKALLTHSCTAALEMSALLLNIQAGDEIIMPSYTFVSTANAFVLRGGVPVFVDIRADTLNLDETLLEAAITPKTRAIVVVHYAGVACEMDSILTIAKLHCLKVIEDAAQGVLASYHGKALGSLGDYGTFSFHETKNISSGEGGALLINNQEDVLNGEIIREKGTNRSQFFRGQVDKYTWQQAGSSFLPGELIAAFLWAQLEAAEQINQTRLASWNHYYQNLQELESVGLLRRPIIPAGCQHNAHMFYILLPPGIDRQAIMEDLKQLEIHAVFHYVPLHSSPAGKRFARSSGSLTVTDSCAERLLRLPLWMNISNAQIDRVTQALSGALAKYAK